MGSNHPNILDDLADITARFGSHAVDEGIERLRDSRIGQTEYGAAVITAVDALVDRYGDDAIAWLIRRLRAHQDRRIDRMVDEAKSRNDEAAARAMERVRAGATGDGHQ